MKNDITNGALVALAVNYENLVHKAAVLAPKKQDAIDLLEATVVQLDNMKEYMVGAANALKIEDTEEMNKAFDNLLDEMKKV